MPWYAIDDHRDPLELRLERGAVVVDRDVEPAGAGHLEKVREPRLDVAFLDDIEDLAH